MRSTDEATTHSQRSGILSFPFYALGQPEIDDFDHPFAFLIDQHEIRGLEIPMDQLLLCRCRQGTGNLQRDPQCFDWAQRAVSFHVPINGFTVDELHGVEITLVIRAEMKD